MQFDSIQIQIRDADGSLHAGRIGGAWHDAEGFSLSAVVKAPRGPALRLGRAAQLGFEGGPLEATVEVAGLVTTRIDSEEEACYHFRFGDAAYQLLGELFEARRTPRVSSPEGEAVPVALRSLDSGARAVVAELVDISVGGAGVGVPLLNESQLAGLQRLRVGMALPGLEEPLMIDTEVRHRTLKGNQVIYGLEFCWPESSDDARCRTIESYVERRLAEAGSRGPDGEVDA